MTASITASEPLSTTENNNHSTVAIQDATSKKRERKSGPNLSNKKQKKTSQTEIDKEKKN